MESKQNQIQRNREQTGGCQRQVVKVVKKCKLSLIRLINLGDKTYNMGFPGGSLVKKNNPPANVRDSSSIPGSRRFPGEGNGNPLQYSCLGSPMDRGAWRATVHGVTKSQTRLSD